jgi:hypothetical protein
VALHHYLVYSVLLLYHTFILSPQHNFVGEKPVFNVSESSNFYS